jgi:hypothetical protein
MQFNDLIKGAVDRPPDYMDQFENPEYIAEKTIGSDWATLSSDHTAKLQKYITYFNRNMERDSPDVAKGYLDEIFTEIDALRQYSSVYNQTRSAKVHEEPEAYSEHGSAPPTYHEDEYESYESDFHDPEHDKTFSDHGPKPETEDVDLMKQYGMQPSTPVKTKKEVFDFPDGPKSFSGFEPAGGAHPPKKTGTTVVYPDGHAVDLAADLPVPSAPAAVAPKQYIPPALGTVLNRRTLQPGPPRTFYRGQNIELHIPEPSNIQLQLLHEAQAMGERPLALKRVHERRKIGEYILIEKTGKRIHVEVDPNLPRKTLNRLVNLMYIHGRKIKEAILTQYIDGTERSRGKLRDLTKSKLRQIFSQITAKTPFIVQAPHGAGIGALDSHFWTHWSVAHYLSQK